MSETRFTPGPWAVHSIFRHLVTLESHKDRTVGGASDPERDLAYYAKQIHQSWNYNSNKFTSSEVEANARLIAAGPELYGALNKCERALTELYPGEVEPDESHIDEYKAVWSAVMDARAALAKAVQP